MQEEKPVSHSLFAISIFRSREVFMALSLGLFQFPEKSVPHLTEMLRRSRNPPISVVYTTQLLEPKSVQAYGLTIIRFLSQLSDLSSGNSMSQSLQCLSEGGFLSEVRHSLTHKHMISDKLILSARTLILNDLKVKYWESIFQQMLSQGLFKAPKVRQEYLRIYGLECNYPFHQEHALKADLVVMQNYQFHIRVADLVGSQPQLQDFLQFLQSLSEFKRTITFSQVLKAFSRDYDNEYYFGLICSILQNKMLKDDSLRERMILHKLKKIRFMNFIEFNKEVLARLPTKVVEAVEEPFQRAREKGVTFYSQQ